jgi:hypothetical protein
MASDKTFLTPEDPIAGAKPATGGNDRATPSTKASFYSRDTTAVSSDLLHPIKKKYMGVERRREDRRKAQDRRDSVRFDLTKVDRRETCGRRKNDASIKFW